MVCNLDQLKYQEEGVIVDFNCSNAVKQAYLEEGFIPGTKVFIDCIAPFGGPMTCKLRNCKVALRRQDAAAITVKRY